MCWRRTSVTTRNPSDVLKLFSDSFRRSQKTCMSIMLQDQWNKDLRMLTSFHYSVSVFILLNKRKSRQRSVTRIQFHSLFLWAWCQYVILAAAIMKVPYSVSLVQSQNIKEIPLLLVLQKLLQSQEALTTSSRMSPSETKDVQRHKGISSCLARFLLSS